MSKKLFLIIPLLFTLAISAELTKTPKLQKEFELSKQKELNEFYGEPTLNNPENRFQTTKTSCILQSEYNNKTQEELKTILISKTKAEALEELYGTRIKTKTELKNGKLISDEIKQLVLGTVRVKGEPSYSNGKNWGEICATLNAYITNEDFAKYEPKQIKLTNFCTNISNQAEANYEAFKQIVKMQKPSIETLSSNQAADFIHGYEISNQEIRSNGLCFDMVANIIPYEIDGFKQLEKGQIAKDYSGNEIVVDNGMVVTFYKKDDLALKNPIASKIIYDNFDLMKMKFLTDGLKDGEVYNITLESMLLSSQNQVKNFKFASDVYSLAFFLNNKSIIKNKQGLYEAELKKGFNYIKVVIKSADYFDVTMFEKEGKLETVILASDLFYKLYDMNFTPKVINEDLKIPNYNLQTEQTPLKEISNKQKMIILLDNSENMKLISPGSSRTMMEQAKLKIIDNIAQLDRTKIDIGMAYFNGTCTNPNFIAPTQTSINQVVDAVATLRPLGEAPLALTMEKIKNYLIETNQTANILLIVSGVDSCGGNIVQTAKQLLNLPGIGLKLNILGIGLDIDAKLQFSALAKLGNGKFIDLPSIDDLGNGFNEISKGDKIKDPHFSENGKTFTFNINFGFNLENIDIPYLESIKSLANYIITNRYPTVIEGHTDNKGSVQYNKELSKKRAESVVKELIKFGVDPKLLKAVGAGMEKPIADNNLEDGMKINRRVEAHFSK